MKTKTLKNFIIFALTILFAGGLFLIPWGNKGKTNAEEEIVTVKEETDVSQVSDTPLWSDTFAVIDTYSLSTITVYGQSGVYKISSATDLAFMAYKVNSGDEDYVNGIFALTANIDLSGSLWTPIGTNTSPFKGIFYGQNFYISNISINSLSQDNTDMSTSYTGLFGLLTDATICDVILGGWQENYAKETYSGALAGKISGTTKIINCYDICYSKINENGQTYNSIGFAENGTFIYRGGYRFDATSHAYIRITTKANVDKTITVKNNYSTAGYVGIYFLNYGSFYQKNAGWYNTKMCKVLMDTNYALINQNIAVIFRGSKPVLRENATDNDVYIYREGYQANLTNIDFTESDFSNGLRKNITTTAKTISVKIDYGYGTRQITYDDWGYDQTFYSYFSKNEYASKRAGYRLSSIIDSKNKLYRYTSTYNYKTSFPSTSSEEIHRMSWTNSNNRLLKILFAKASDEGGVFTAGAESAVVSMNSNASFNGTELAKDNSSIETGTTNSYSFYVKLHNGYQIGNLNNASTQSTIITDGKADKTSGAYPNFNVHSGPAEDADKNTYQFDDSINNDDYLPVSTLVEFIDEDESSQKIYKITVSNLCNSNTNLLSCGDVCIVIEREWVQVDFEFSVYETESEQTTYTFGLEDEEEQENGANLFRVEGDTLYSRRGETPELFISTLESSIVSYVLEYPGDDSIHQFINVSGEADSSFTVNSTTYYKYFTFNLSDKNTDTLENNGLASEGKAVFVGLGPLKTMISLTLVDSSGREIENTDGTLGAYINSTAEGEFLGNVDAVLVAITGNQDTFRVRSNGFYQASYIEIDGVKIEADFEDDEDDGNYRLLTTTTAYLTEPYINGTEGVNHEIEIHFEERDFNVKFEFYFDGVKIQKTSGATLDYIGLSGHELIKDISKEYFDRVPGNVLNVSFKMTNLGLGALKFTRYSLINDDGTAGGASVPPVGYSLSSLAEGYVEPSISNSGQGSFAVNLGTYETIVKIYFEYRQARISVDSLYLNGVLRSNALNTGLIGQILTTNNLKFTYSQDTERLVLNYIDDTKKLGNLSLHTQYYLLGWYLQNGNVITQIPSSNYDSFFANSDFADSVATAGSTSEQVVNFTGLSAGVGQRKVYVEYNAGEAGLGRLFNSDKLNEVTTNVEAGVVTYDQKLTLSNEIFFNLGYAFKGWSATNGSVNGLEYSISGGADAMSWSMLFDSSTNLYREWGIFATDTESKSDVGVENTIILTAQWEKINYYLSIDNDKQVFISIGDSIYYTTDQSLKNGRATYYIAGDTEGVNGTTRDGYIVIGYALESGETINNYGANNIYTLNPDNFDQLIADEFRFAVNTAEEGEVIKLTTLREAAKYLLYLDNSSENFYSYTWDEILGEGLGNINAGQITVEVTFDQNPVNLSSAISNGALTISRMGYEVAGWAISNGGVQYEVFPLDAPYTYARDQHIVPIWRKTENKVQSVLEFTNDVGSIRNFYLEKEHDILLGGLTGDNVTAGMDLTTSFLANGEIITDFGFVVTYNSTPTKYSRSNLLNYNWFNLIGEYSVVFYIDVCDSLNVLGSYPAESYTTTSDTKTFNILKNEIFFYGHNLRTIYTGTSEFVAGAGNEFGKFIYRYDWNGNDLSLIPDAEKVSNGDTEDYFESFEVVQHATEGFDVGNGKTLKLTLSSTFGEGDFSARFANVTLENGKYTATINELTIDQAEFVITFPEGSAYYIEGIRTIVYNNSLEYSFSVGSSNFTYTYDKILLKDVSYTPPVVFQGDSARGNYEFVNFVVDGVNADSNGNFKNFKWIISDDSKFNLLDPTTALKLDYQTKYLSANNGQLKNVFDDVYGVKDTVSIANIYIDGNAMTIPSEIQFTFNVENEVLLYVYGQNSQKIYIYVNKSVLGEGHILSFDIVVNISTERKQVLKPLNWAESTVSTSALETCFDDFNADYSKRIEPLYSDEDSSKFIVLTDVVKVNVDYNGGHNGFNQTQEILYISKNNSFNLVNPTYNYPGIVFDGYKQSGSSNITLTASTGQFVLACAGGGKTETIKAKWLFNEISGRLITDTISLKASTSAQQILLSDVAIFIVPSDSTVVYTLKRGSASYAYSELNGGNFSLQNENGWVVPNMSGTYTISASVTYSDGNSAPQTKIKSFEFEIEITKNEINITYENTATYTFSNQRQESNVKLIHFIDGTERNINLLNLPTTDNSGSEYFVHYTSSAELFDAGDYTITIAVDSDFNDIYTIDGSSQKIITLTIEKYTINLADYSATINQGLSKIFGDSESNPLITSIVIAENVNDQIALKFERQNKSEAIGRYPVECLGIDGEKVKNYEINAADSELYFTIKKPGGNLTVEFKDKFSYIYNGQAVSSFELTYSGGKYLLSINPMFDRYESSDKLQVEIDIYILNQGNKILIPEDQKEAYANMLEFETSALADVGTYSINVNFNESAGEEWTSVEVLDLNLAKIVVSKRQLKVLEIVKVYNETTSLKYNNINQESNTCEVTLENLVGSDEVELEGSFLSTDVGMQEISSLTLTNVGKGGNYELVLTTGLKVKVIADNTTEIEATLSGANNVEYGNITYTTTLSNIKTLFPLVYNHGAIDANNIEVTAFVIEESAYSTGKYLNAGNYTIKFTLASKNYTFKQARVENLDNVYTLDVEIAIVVDKKEITITNGSKITKVYDGNDNVESKYLNVNVGEGIYAASGMLEGDVLTIKSEKYIDRTIGTNKDIINVVVEGDTQNYDITTNIKGDITNVSLVFNKNGASIEFVDGVKSFGNTAAIQAEYAGDIGALITNINDNDNYLTRVGYTQVGFKYQGKLLSEMTAEEKEIFLQAAVDAGESGITIDAVWQINNVTLTFSVQNADIYIQNVKQTSITVDYYTTFDSIEIRGNNGYTFEGFTLSKENVVNQVTILSGLSSKTASLKVENILDDLTILVSMTEIEVKIILDYNQPVGFEVTTDESGWDTRERILKYSQAKALDLPEIKLTQEKTYDFDYWMLDTNLSEGNNIWDRIAGDSLTQDNITTGFTFVAYWTESELTLTLDKDANINVEIKKGENVLTIVGNTITIHYLDSLEISVVANDWYKWSVFNLTGEASLSGNTLATNNISGSFALSNIKSDIILELKSSYVNVTFTTSYEALDGATISQENGTISGVYFKDSHSTIGDLLATYTPTVGTYQQINWIYQTRNVEFNSNIEVLVMQINNGIPTEDISIALKANFEGLKYVVTFDKGIEEGATFTENTSAQTVTREYIYGSTMTNFPVIEKAGRSYIYKDSEGVSYREGQQFTTSLANASLTLTLTADWTYVPYTVTLNLTTLANKVNVIKYSGFVYTAPVEVVYGDNLNFVFDLAEGYELDTAATLITSGSVNTTLNVESANLGVLNVQQNTEITVALKAKDYTITIIDHYYEDISQKVFNVSYDQDVSNIFDGVTMQREGYTLLGINQGEEIFATYSGGWNFDGDFTSENLYKYDGNLNLTIKWDYVPGYVNVSTSVASGLYYNGQEQTIATSQFIVQDGQTFAINATFTNGDKVKEVYYLLDGNRIETESNFSLKYTDYISANVQIVAVIEDTHTAETYEIRSTATNVTLNKSEVNIIGATIESYYSESAVINNTENTEYGALYFHDKTTVNAEIAFVKAEIIDASGLYSVKAGYEVKYFFTVNSAFKETNYSGLVKEGGYYTLSTSDMVDKVYGEIIATPVTIIFNEQGYYNGAKQVISNFSTTFPDYATTFRSNITSITTKTADIKKYQTADEFEIDGKILNVKGDDRTSNFIFVINGGYEIVSTANAFRIDYSARYLNLHSAATLEKLSNEYYTITSFSYADETVNVDKATMSYVSGGKLILTITNNGNDGQFVYVTKGESVTFNFALNESAPALIGAVNWTASSNVDTIVENLKTLESEGARSQSISFSSDATYYAIVTDYRAIKMSLGDKGGDQGFIFVKKGETGNITTPEAWTGFQFASWQVGATTTNITITGNAVYVATTSKITVGEIVAKWTLVSPEITGKTFTFTAKVGLNATQTVSLNDILDGGIKNQNNSITYSYSYMRDGVVIATSESMTVSANTTSAGEYEIAITASYSNYATKTTTEKFNIVVNRLKLDSMVLSATEFTYANKNYIPEISVTFTGDVVETKSLNTLMSETASSYYFTLTGKGTSEIRLAGEYNLTLNLNETIFDKTSFADGFEFETVIKVNKANLQIAQIDIPLDKASKLYLEDDPDFTITKTMFVGANQENVIVVLTRAAGEDLGSYAFNRITSENENYNLSIADGTVFTIRQSNLTLNVKIDNKISVVYSKSAPDFTVYFDQTSNKWMVGLGSSSSTLTLTYFRDVQKITLTGELYRHALERVDFESDEAINAGSYFGNDIEAVVATGQTANFAGYEITGEFEITKLALQISKVEKVFDRTDEFVQSGVAFANLIAGDSVELGGRYTSVFAGENITLKNLSLGGTSAGNYSIANPEFLGKITKKAVDSIVISLKNNEFDYGQITKDTTVNQLLQLAGGYNFANGAVADDIEKGYISISSFTVADSDLNSTKDRVKAGEITIKIVLTSGNFSGLETSGYDVVIKINALELDLSALNIVKEYDENTLLPSTLSTSLAGYIIAGDEASIDLTKGGYDNANIGENKQVTIILTGADAGNYVVRNNVTGTITAYVITLKVEADTENADLVTDGAFVSDGQTPIVLYDNFTLYYPANNPASETLSKLTFPTRKGYTATGWKYYNGTSYVQITTNNIYDILKSVAEDKTNTDKSINIYTVWEINTYTISVSGINADIEYTATPENSLTTGATTKITYYSSFDMKATLARGFKIKQINLTSGVVASSTLTDLGKSSGIFTFQQVSSDLNIEIVGASIEVTFDFTLNIPSYTSRTDGNSLNAKFNYTEMQTKTQSDLPRFTVTAGTYTFDDFKYNGNVEMGTKTLKAVVDELYASLTTDVRISLTALWKGVDYTIKFDPNGGVLAGADTITAVYGSAITNAFPTANLPGRSIEWKNGEVVYVQGDVLRSVGELKDGAWSVTFTANWINNPYTLKVNFDDKLTVLAGGLNVTNGQEFTLVYNQTKIIFSVQAQTGYIFEYDASALNGEITAVTNGYEVKNLVDNGTLTFSSLPDDNILTISTDKVESVKGYVVDGGDTEIQIVDGKLTAKTESVIKVVFTSLKGWIFNENCLTFIGSGSYTTQISADKKVLTLNWTNFIEDANVNVVAEADDLEITTSNLTAVFETLTFNSQPVNLNGDTIIIKTGATLNIVGSLVYGYRNGVVSTTDGEIKVQNNEFSASDRQYRFTATIEEFDEDFALTFTCQAREYIFNISVRESDVAFGQITGQTNQTVKFGEALELKQTTLIATFIFENWLYAETKVLDFTGNGELILSRVYFDMLESVNEGETINIVATYKRNMTYIDFTSIGRGSFTVVQQAEGVDVEVLNGQTINVGIYMTRNVDFVITPNEGYELDKMYINDEEKSFDDYGFDADNMTMSVYIDIDSTITSIKISFKASEATVYVQAALRVNYEDYYGTTAGGHIYLTDSTGSLLGDELYLTGKNGNLLIGGDYSVLSYTDATVYFAVQVNNGYTLAISASKGVLINEYQGANGKVYSFANVKDGSTIIALFTAKENVVNVKFALEGQTSLAHAGIIEADTSSNFVSAIPNRGDNISVSIITGEDLVLQVNSSLAYRLVTDEYGYVKYKIIYPDNDDQFTSIHPGTVNPSNSTWTGYTESSTFSIEGVTTGATIIFYVQPREYTIRYFLFDAVSVTMEKKVRYGENWSASYLTQEEKATVFANRSGYTFLGYYTMPNGQGVPYIDRYGKVVNAWLEDGYAFNGSTYEIEDNFDDATSTFTLYANWLYNRADVTIKFIPSDVTQESKYNISSVITNLGSLSAWISQDNKWYSEIVIGATLNIKAVSFEGYTFEKWLVSFKGSEAVEKPATFNINNLEMGSYLLTAVYKPNYDLSVTNENNGNNDGGTVELLQDGNPLSQGCYDSAKKVTLRAIPKEGYRFLYFVDNNTGNKIYGTIDSRGVGTYTYASLQTKPISITAVFTGKTIIISLDTIEIQTLHQLVSVKINDKGVDYKKLIYAKVGDTIKVTILKSRGYGIDISGAVFTYQIDANRNYIYSHQFKLNELTAVDVNTYSINIKFAAPKEAIRFSFDIDVEDAYDADEADAAGNLILSSTLENINIKEGLYYTVLYGDTANLNIIKGENYILSRIYLYANEMTYDIASKIKNNSIVIDEELMNEYFDYDIKITVIFERLVWTDIRADDFQGGGTKKNPYIISSAEEFALLSYLVNNGIENKNGKLYARCYYKVTRNIDFFGRFFEPIGTKENKFNGTINIGRHKFTNVSHYREYNDPRPSVSGLFWHLGSKANIIQPNDTIWIVIGIVAGSVVFVGGVVLIVLLHHKRRKKRFNDIADE